jgi:hypothetical protein
VELEQLPATGGAPLVTVEVVMRADVLGVVTVWAALVLTASPGLAHHFMPRESDKAVPIEGTVVRFDMINPHSRLFIEVEDATGRVDVWEIELGSVQALLARGWTRDALKPGDVVRVDAILWKGRANAAAARDVEWPDGRRLFGGSHAGDYPRR